MERNRNMAKVSDLRNSKFLAKEDVTPARKVTIVGWDKVDVSMESKPTKMRHVLMFKEVEKPLVLNTTNGDRIEVLTGTDDFDGWIGFEITLFNDPEVYFGTEKKGGIRVLMPQPAAPTSPMPTTQQQADYNAASDGEPKVDPDGIPF